VVGLLLLLSSKSLCDVDWLEASSVMGVKLLSCTGRRRRQHERLDGSRWKTRTGRIAGGTSAGEGVEARQLRWCMIEIEIEIARNVYMQNPSALLLREAYYCMYRLLIEHVHGCVFANLLDQSQDQPLSLHVIDGLPVDGNRLPNTAGR
jgi:hypothetical protein